jgi:hypothetical protein
LLSACALFLTYVAVGVIARTESENSAGWVLFDAVIAALAAWVEWRAIQAWRQIVTADRDTDPY